MYNAATGNIGETATSVEGNTGTAPFATWEQQPLEQDEKQVGSPLELD